jgi:predicted outer membrane repeat protein
MLSMAIHGSPARLWIIFLASLPCAARSATIRIPADVASIQQALDEAADGDTLVVAPGDYVLDRTLEFTKLGLVSPGSRNVTLRSEGGPEVTVILLSSRPLAGQLGSVIVFRGGEGPSSVLEGFTISGGIGSHINSATRGGGILCLDGSSPSLINCRIIDNTAELGGGVYSERSSPRFRSCIIAGSRARTGGGLFAIGGDLVIIDTVIHGNTASIECAETSCKGGSGGGVFLADGTRASFVGCDISDNHADGFGGGLDASTRENLLLERCSIRNNVATIRGGGILTLASGPRLLNCIISLNRAKLGGGIYGSAQLDQCTVVANTVGGGIDGGGTIKNSILWANGGGSVVTSGAGIPGISFSCVQSQEVWPGMGNINEAPRFCLSAPGPDLYFDASAAQEGDGSQELPFRDLGSALEPSYSLAADSPCLGAGEGGSDMGARVGRCGPSGEPVARRLHVARGIYPLHGLAFSDLEVVVGEGQGVTYLVGTVSGMTGRLENLTVTGSRVHGGVVIGSGEAPEITDVTVEENASAFEGGGIRCDAGSRPTFLRCTIRDNSAESGGGIYCGQLSEPTFIQCTIRDNSALLRGGGVQSNRAMALFQSCTLRANRVTGQNGDGGGVWASGGACKLVDCVIAQNVSERSAGVGGAAAMLDYCTISGNSGQEAVRAVHALRNSIVWSNDGSSLGFGDDHPREVAYSCIQGNAAPSGEGNIAQDPLFCGWGDVLEVQVDPSAPPFDSDNASFRTIAEASEPSLALAALSPCRGSGESATDMGADRGSCSTRTGGIRTVRLAAGTYREPFVRLDHGVSLLGAGMESTIVEGALLGLGAGASLSDLSVTRSAAHGGVAVAARGDVLLKRVRIAGNLGLSSVQVAGGLTCGANSTSVLEDCIIEGNRGWYAGGIGCARGASLTLRRCFVVGNASLRAGGGIRTSTGGRVVLENCVVAANAANFFGDGNGGAIYSEADVLELHSSTIVANTVLLQAFSWAVRGGRSTTAINTIIWGNFTRESLVADSSRRVLLGSAIEGFPPGAGGLALAPRFRSPGEFDFGRFRDVHLGARRDKLPDFVVAAPDYRPAEDSPVIDAGISAGAPSADILGESRPCWYGFDIGAYEYCEARPPRRQSVFIRGDVNGDATLTIADPVFFLQYFFLGGPPPACLDAADVDDSGALSIVDPILSLTFQFLGGVTLPPPLSCGNDPTFDDLDCEAHDACD